jgi:AmmeMemoRadiSam system protein B
METRDPVVAGMFYFLDRENLENQVKGMLSRIKEKPRFRIVVSPHAGYEYSGKTAARSIKSLKEASTFILLGPNHNLAGPEFSVMDKGVWRTPLGDIKIDQKLAEKIIKAGVSESDTIAHSAEHSIEVQLPILQILFKSFKIVPISIANCNYSEAFLKRCESLGKALAKLMKTNDINVIASSDFSHYISAEEAKRKDTLALDRICHLDNPGFFDVLKDESGSVCGYGPIAVAVSAARHLSLKKGEVLEYTSSGETTKDYNAVVGYASIGFE